MMTQDGGKTAQLQGDHEGERGSTTKFGGMWKILVTNLDEWLPRQVVSAYQRRWPVEQINRELKTDLGLGEHQVSGEEGRIENSFGIAVLAYLLLIRACHQEMLPGTSWSIAQLQHALRLRIITKQVEHNVKRRLTKARKVA